MSPGEALYWLALLIVGLCIALVMVCRRVLRGWLRGRW